MAGAQCLWFGTLQIYLPHSEGRMLEPIFNRLFPHQILLKKQKKVFL